MALQGMLPARPEAPRRVVSKAALTEQLERIRMDAAQALAEVVALQARLTGILEASGYAWRELTGEEAPEVEIRARVVRAS
jgi:hypothetical protein